MALLAKRHRVLAVLAGLSTWWVSAIYLGFHVGSAEDAVLTGVADHATTQYFLAVNLPAHISFALIYLASMALLLAVPLLERSTRRPEIQATASSSLTSTATPRETASRPATR